MKPLPVFGLEACLILRCPLECNDTIKRAGLHAAEAQAAGCRHFSVLVSDINIERTGSLGLAVLALLAFGPVVADAPEASLAGKSAI